MKNLVVIGILGGMFAAFVAKRRGAGGDSSGASVDSRPINIKNNNPGNIVKTSKMWKGEIASEGRFKKFSSWVWGVRAMIINLRAYFGRGENTVQQIIERWAPVAENGQKAVNGYITFVSQNVGVLPSQPMTFSPKYIFPLVDAMARFEGGSDLARVTKSQFNQAWERI